MTAKQEPIIILGFPRSGTTLIRRMLDAHHNIDAPGETFLLRSAARFLRGETIANGLDYGVIGGLSSIGGEPQELYTMLRGIVCHFHEHSARQNGKSRWVEKTAVDAFYIDEIETLFGEEARFICVVRHGLDVVASCHDLTESCERFLEEFHPYICSEPAPDVAYAQAWADSVQRLLRFQSDHQNNAILLRYEELLSDAEGRSQELLSFLGEEWDSAVIEVGPSEIGNIGMGDWKTYDKKGFDDSSIGRWKEFSDSRLARIMSIVNPVLEECGYEAIDAYMPAQTPEAALRRYEMSMMMRARKAQE